MVANGLDKSIGRQQRGDEPGGARRPAGLHSPTVQYQEHKHGNQVPPRTAASNGPAVSYPYPISTARWDRRAARGAGRLTSESSLPARAKSLGTRQARFLQPWRAGMQMKRTAPTGTRILANLAAAGPLAARRRALEGGSTAGDMQDECRTHVTGSHRFPGLKLLRLHNPGACIHNPKPEAQSRHNAFRRITAFLPHMARPACCAFGRNMSLALQAIGFTQPGLTSVWYSAQLLRNPRRWVIADDLPGQSDKVQASDLKPADWLPAGPALIHGGRVSRVSFR